ncbi:N-6 DNA methylase (plasmid) [Streptomyces sp. BI20]|uniref:N-6 DNA methylase n=1 Tax=Streptomyces sp. BI20 TaxID=3403460 RepID=UPI003C73FE41
MGHPHDAQYADDPQITRARIAELADVTRPTVTGWEKRYADFPSPRKAGGAAYFLQSGILDWLDGRSVPLHLRRPDEDEEATYGRRARGLLARGVAAGGLTALAGVPAASSGTAVPPDAREPSDGRESHDQSAPPSAEGRNQQLVGELMALADEVRGPGSMVNFLQLLLALHFLRTVSPDRWNSLRSKAAEAEAGGGTAGQVLEYIGREVDAEVRRLGMLPHFTEALADLVPRNAGVLVAVVVRVGKLDGDAFQLFIEAYESHGRLRSREFFTPKGVVRLMAALAADSFEGVPRSAYDPYVRGGECLVAALEFLEDSRHRARSGRELPGRGPLGRDPLPVAGRTQVPDAGRLASLNLALHGVQAGVRLDARPPWAAAGPDTHRFDLVLTNPPFNMKDSAGQAVRRGTWAYGPPPLDNDNFAYVQHVLASLKEGGRAVVVMPSKAGNSFNPAETAIRKEMLADGVVECVIGMPAGLFSGTAVPVSLWLLRHPGTPCDHVLFLDARHLGTRNRRKGARTVLHKDEVLALVAAYQAGRNGIEPTTGVPSARVERQTLIEGPCSLSPVDHVRPTPTPTPTPTRPDPRYSADETAWAPTWAEVARLTQRTAAADERADAARRAIAQSREGMTGGTPEGWRTASLDELCEIKAGPSFSVLGTAHRGPTGTVPVVFSRHFRAGRITDTQDERVSAELARRLGHFALEAGDILCVRAGKPGPPAIVRPDQAGWLPSANLTRLRVREDADVDPDYLLAWLSRPEVLGWVEDRAAATAASSISTATLGRLQVRLPAPAQQRRIADVLAHLQEQVLAHEELAAALTRARCALGEKLMSPPPMPPS